MMTQQELNRQLELYLQGNLNDNAFDLLKQRIANNQAFAQQLEMCTQLNPYINSELYGQQLDDFEAYLDQSSFLQKQVQIYQTAIKAIQDYGSSELLKHLSRLDKKLDEEFDSNPTQYENAFENEAFYLEQVPFDVDENGELVFKKEEEKIAAKSPKIVAMPPPSKNHNKSSFSWNSILQIAAILLVLLIPAYLYFPDSQQNKASNQLFAQFFQNIDLKVSDNNQSMDIKAAPAQAAGGKSWDPKTIDAVGGKTITGKTNTTPSPKARNGLSYNNLNHNAENLSIDFSKARNSYQKKNYQKAAPLFEKLAQELPEPKERMKAQLYAGTSWLGARNTNKAISILEAILSQKSPLSKTYEAEAQWYLGLAFIQKNQLQKAKAIFEKLALDHPQYTSKTTKILKNL